MRAFFCATFHNKATPVHLTEVLEGTPNEVPFYTDSIMIIHLFSTDSTHCQPTAARVERSETGAFHPGKAGPRLREAGPSWVKRNVLQSWPHCNELPGGALHYCYLWLAADFFFAANHLVAVVQSITRTLSNLHTFHELIIIPTASQLFHF